jgi:hypothetical protein
MRAFTPKVTMAHVYQNIGLSGTSKIYNSIFKLSFYMHTMTEKRDPPSIKIKNS